MISRRSGPKASYRRSSFQVKDPVRAARAAAKSRCECWIDATAATAWLQSAAAADIVVPNVRTHIHTDVRSPEYLSFLHRHSHSYDPSSPSPSTVPSSSPVSKPSLFTRGARGLSNHPLSLLLPLPRPVIPAPPTSFASGRSNTTAEPHGPYLWDCNPHFDVMLLPVGKTYCKKPPTSSRDCEKLATLNDRACRINPLRGKRWSLRESFFF